ncbi:MAG: DUF4080 domain-containing protein, partial [Candidatus Omnitrophota bacterium]
ICLESGTDIQLALYYLKGYLLHKRFLRKPACNIQIKTFNEICGVSNIVRAILRQKPALVGFSCYLWNIEKTLRVCRELKENDPTLVVVLGGPEVSPRAEEILKKYRFIDIIVRGEGEETFAQCIDRIANKAGLSGVEGISFRQQGPAARNSVRPQERVARNRGRPQERVISNPDRMQMKRLTGIPSPYLSGLLDPGGKDIVDVPLETTRGCSSRCGYCYYHKNFSRVRFFPLARVENELKLILSRKPREVYLMDATFNSHPARAKKILKFFIKYNRGSCLHVELKAEFVDEEMARLLRAAQAFNIEIGIQSIHAKTLRAVNRRFNKKMFARGIRLLNKYGLFYEIQLIDALPFQSYVDLKRSLDWLYGLHPVKVAIFRLCLLPGTSLRLAARRFGIVYTAIAPYNAIRSNAMSAGEVLRIERLRDALGRLYDSQVFQNTLYALEQKGRIRISDVFDGWISWFNSLPSHNRITPDGLNRMLPVFLRYVCRSHGISCLYPELLPGLLKDLSV